MQATSDFRVGPCTTRDAAGCLWTFYYENLSEIGRGGFGTVYVADRRYVEPRSGTDGRKYAIKVLRMPSKEDAENRALIERRIRLEMQVHERLKGGKDDPHVVAPISLMRDGDLHLIVTEYCPGGDLAKFLRSRQFPLDEVTTRRIMRHVTLGVSSLHRAGFIHRDIKEANIFVCKDAEDGNQECFKIGDFGLAADAEDVNTTMCGTRRFMAPEMNGRRPYGRSVDIWSLGILFFTLLTGKSHPNEDVGAGSIGRTTTPPPPLAKDLLDKMLVQDPAHRISLDGVLNHPYLSSNGGRGLSSSMGSGIDSGIVSTSNNSSPSTFNVMRGSGASPAGLSILQEEAERPTSAVPSMMRPLNPLLPTKPSLSSYSNRNAFQRTSGPLIGGTAKLGWMVEHDERPAPETLENFSPSSQTHQKSVARMVAANMPSTLISSESNSHFTGVPIDSAAVSTGKAEKPKGAAQQNVSLAKPFSTQRLRPTVKKHKFKVGTGAISVDGSVTMEFNITKRQIQNGLPSTLSVLETMTISADGKLITIDRDDEYDETRGRKLPPKVYQRGELPNKYWAKYNYAAKFINIVRESTPKVTFYTDKAMCRLMENGSSSQDGGDANFEVHFYGAEGPKFVYSSTKGTVTVSDGTREQTYSKNTITVDGWGPKLSEEWALFRKYHERAKRLEQQFENFCDVDEGQLGDSRQCQLFPVVLGRRPTSFSTSSILRPSNQANSDADKSSKSQSGGVGHHLMPHRNSMTDLQKRSVGNAPGLKIDFRCSQGYSHNSYS